ncbi:ARID domain-containing protein [Pleurotus pulmonarius]
MADRGPPSYPSIQNFNPSMLQQHSQQQAQANQQNQLSQAQQQQLHQMQDLQQGQPGSMSMQDNARLWQQMQQFPQFRNLAPGMEANQQMAELLRNRTFNQHNPQQQQQQQQFTLGVNPLGGGPQHPPTFHDQPNGQPNMPPGFPNMALGMANRNMALQALQARQLDLMAMAQNQQNQNGPINNLARMAQLQAMQREQAQHHQQREQLQSNGSSDSFNPPRMPTPDAVRRSPSHASPQPPPGVANSPNMPPNRDGPQAAASLPARRMMTPTELRERSNQLRVLINTAEQSIMQLSASRGSLPEATFMQKMTVLQSDLKGKKEYFAKLNAALQAPQFPVGGGTPFPGHPTGQTSGWTNQTGGPSFGPPQGQHAQNGSMGGPSMHSIQSPAQLHPQANHMINGVPPRSGPTPTQQQREQMHREQQHLGAQFGGNRQISPPPSMNQPFGFGPANGGTPSNSNPALPLNTNAGGVNQHTLQGGMVTLPPPLQKPRFDETYGNFCKSRNVNHDPRMLSVDGRTIDLHMLHRQVLLEGGIGKVNQKDLWAVIGARMGFVSFPASDTEPAKSGPAVAGQLAHVYKEYLAAFDMLYIQSVIEQKKKQMIQQNQLNQNQNQGNGHPNGGPGGPESSGAGGLNIGAMNPQQRPSLTPQHMQMMVQYASRSAAELRAQGIHERVIQFVEQNRATLQRNALDQDRFRGQFRPGTQPGQGGLSSGVVKDGNGGAQNPAGSAPQHNLAPPFGGLPTRGPMPTNSASAIITSLMRSEPQLTQTALKIIQQLKTNIPQQLEPLRSATAIVSPDQRMEYNQLIEQVFHASQELDAKLPMFYVLLNNDEMLKELVAINYSIQTQRGLLSSNQPRFVISLENLRSMAGELGRAKEIFQVALTNLVKSQQAAAANAQGGPNGAPPPGPSHQPSLLASSNAPQNRPTGPIRPPQTKPKTSIQPSPNASAISAPTPPAASASTPGPSASSPMASATSPPTPKSPKTKSQKAKPPPPKQRRPSKVGTAPIIPPGDPPRPPSATAGVKRAREDEPTVAGPSSNVANGASPPKRIKTEWDSKDGNLMEGDAEKQAIDSIKTPEDANAFMEKMAELIKLAGEGQSSIINTNIAESLDEILKGYGGAPDADSSIGAIDNFHLSSDAPVSVDNNDLEEFFNFSSFANDEDDAGSKAATPDLIHSSSTNPSPASNAESEAGHPSSGPDVKTEIKTEDGSDSLRLGMWKEIDGGESSFYHSNNDWKWDGPMTTIDSSWALLS